MAVDGVVQSSMQQSGVPGMTVAIAKNDTMLYVQGYGVTDLTTRAAAQPKVTFEIGSITKQFTAALIMKLQEQGKLHVDGFKIAMNWGNSQAAKGPNCFVIPLAMMGGRGVDKNAR